MLLKFIVTFLVSIVGMQEAHAGDDRLKAEVADFYVSYMLASNKVLNTGDGADMALHYHNPSLSVVSPRQKTVGPVSYGSRKQGLATFYDGLKSQGVTKIAWEKVDIHILSPNSAVASNIGIRLGADGKVLSRVGATYSLFKGADGWKIITLLIHDADSVIKLN